MYPLVSELAAKDAPVRVPVTVTCRVLKIAGAEGVKLVETRLVMRSV